MEGLKIGVISDGSGKGGVYDILASFPMGLKEGFLQEGVDSEYLRDYVEKGIYPHICIAFNASGCDMFEEIIKANLYLILWSVDSVFYKNFNLIQKFASYPNFAAVSITRADKMPIRSLIPNLNHFYMPVGTDPEIWKNDGTNNEHDIVFMSSITDYEREIEKLKSTFSPQVFKFFMEVIDYLMKSPDKTVWDAFSLLTNNGAIDPDIYSFFFTNVCYIITHAKRIELVKSLEDIGVKVWGMGPWEKYISGKNQHMGQAQREEAIKITQQSKIVLHQHPVQVADGMHDRVINAAAAGAFVVSNDVPAIREDFNDTLLYFDPRNYDALRDGVRSYLDNDSLRKEKAIAAREITLEKHTWRSRAREIVSLINK